MSCAAESLYQLDFKVKTITRCSRSEDTCVRVAIQFLNNPELTVCEIPAGMKNTKCDGTADAAQSNGTKVVGLGKKFTFAIPGGGSSSGGRCSGSGGPKPVRVNVRLYQDEQRGPVELGSGDLEVVSSTDDRHQLSADDEQTVSIKESGGQSGAGAAHSERDIVAALVVMVRMSCVGPIMAVPLESMAGRGRTADRECEKKRTPRSQKLNNGCCGAVARDPTHSPQRTSRRQCTNCTTISPGTTTATASHDATEANDHNQSQHQYMTVNCEINGRKFDLRVRKKNPETCAIQKQIAREAETFAESVVNLVSEMHGFISNPVNAPAPSKRF